MATETKYPISDEDKRDISNIRTLHERLYSDMDRLMVQVILTYMHHSPMTVEEVHKIAVYVDENFSIDRVALLLKELVKNGFAEEKSENSYEPTVESEKVLHKEGITQKYLFED